MTSFRDWKPAKAAEHNAKVARDAQAARENPRTVRKLNDARERIALRHGQDADSCAQKRAVAVLEPNSERQQGTWRFCIPGDPFAAPRMTQSDKWKKRPCVMRYREWSDKARAAAPSDMTQQPLRVHIQPFIAIPESWSKKKKAQYAGAFHRQRLDGDNLLKACADALFAEDGCVAIMSVEKRWDDGNGPRMLVTVSTD